MALVVEIGSNHVVLVVETGSNYVELAGETGPMAPAGEKHVDPEGAFAMKSAMSLTIQ